MKVVIDRFEGQYAVCIDDDKKILNIQINKLPENAKPGQVLNIDGNVVCIDEKSTSEREAKIKKLMDQLWE